MILPIFPLLFFTLDNSNFTLYTPDGAPPANWKSVRCFVENPVQVDDELERIKVQKLKYSYARKAQQQNSVAGFHGMFRYQCFTKVQVIHPTNIFTKEVITSKTKLKGTSKKP